MRFTLTLRFVKSVFDPLGLDELHRGFAVAQSTRPGIVSFVDDVDVRAIEPFGQQVAVATFVIFAHVVDAVEADVEPLAVRREDLWPEGGLALVLGEAAEDGAEFDVAGDADAVAEGMYLVMDLAHVLFFDGLEDPPGKLFQQPGVNSQ